MIKGRSRAACSAIFRNSVSVFALTVVASGAAHAQDSATTDDQAAQAQQSSTGSTEAPSQASPGDDIVVVGVRRALATSQDIKRNANTVVDSITATDIGAFPDKSASEALSRVPGITVNRLQSADDSTHPSGEPTSVLIRGLPFVKTEFNGRDSFSADSARGLNFNDVSPELLAGVDAYKNLTAEMIEGGIAGTVNLRTRLPFDSKGLQATGTFRMNYGDRSGRWTPEFSALVSNTWDTEAGRFGLMADYAQSHVVTRTESVIMDKIDTYCTGGFGTQASATITNGAVACNGNPFGGTGWAYAPDGVRFSEVDYDRKRRGIAAAAQYENVAGNFRLTAQYTNSHYKNAWFERASHAIFDGNYFGTPAFFPRTSTILGPAPGTPALAFGSDGMLQSGVLTQGHGFWRGSFESDQAAADTGSAVPGIPFVNSCAGGTNRPCSSLRDGMRFENEARNFGHREGTKDYSLNARWDVTDRLHTNFDVQYVDATTYNNDILVAAGSLANMDYRVNSDGTPQITSLPGSNVNYADGGLANPHNYWIPFIQGHVEDNDGTELALRADAEYDFDEGGWLDSLKVGVRNAERKQTVRYSTFNWTPIAASWNCNGPGFNADNTSPAPYPACAAGHPPFQGYGDGIWESYALGGGNFYDGDVYDNGDLVYLNRDTLRDFDRLIGALGGAATNSPIGSGYTAICDRPEATEHDCFTPSEVMRLKERTLAGYAMLRFGGDDTTLFGNVTVKGNIGLRVVRTTENSRGSVAFPAATTLLSLPACGTPLSGNAVVNPRCYLTADTIAFASGGGTDDTYKASFTNWLPSFNLRLGLPDRTYVRFAYSRAISRPDIGLLRNFVSINAPVINTGPDSPYVVYNSPTAAHTAANVTGYNFVFRAEAGNAGLKPVVADQFDVSFEKYFGPSSSFTVDAFYKKLRNTVSYGLFTRQFTNNGSTQNVEVRGPDNEKGGGKLYGFEAAFQTFFDFLPQPFDGLGTQLNYTYVKQSGINNSNLINATSGGGVGAVGIGVPVEGGTALIDSHKLQGISKHTFNAVALYEKGPLGVRLAYNWRSRYLTNNLDCCIGLPVYQKAAGFLDGSIRYSINKYLELSLDASNLLNTTTVYEQQIFGDSIATPGAKPVYFDSAWNRVDRRYQFGVRVKF
ncbi:TonB-dependent receptor [Sphingomonas piscis]|uniref:TonB-dependent receptor n=1 Tax=Sphingomonas piscis TaxID=2714943 RepID=A0A6G7YN60_9SPHN|nr:TonB-dependent receptor [Sphingomonas piscis]QIK78167.1 TonB-dependent receptor [Sphingomonas piscis]